MARTVGTALVVVSLGLAAQGCLLGPEVEPVALEAYRCAVPLQAQCATPGERIPPGTLPPRNEAFIVAARYMGSASRWTLMYPSRFAAGYLDSTVIYIDTPDSASVWINLRDAKEGYYVERVSAAGSAPDSVIWEFGWRRPVTSLDRVHPQYRFMGLP